MIPSHPAPTILWHEEGSWIKKDPTPTQTNVEHRVGPFMAGNGRWVPSRPPVGIWLVGTVIFTSLFF